MKKILITGPRSGIGKFLAKKLKNGNNSLYLLNRSNFEKIKKIKFDFIVHCAGKRPIFKSKNKIYDYYEDNIKLTEKITNLSFKKIIYFSTVDVYENSSLIKKENIKININNLKGIYPLTKLISESIIANKSQNYLIIRLPTLIGKTMRITSLYNILKKKNSFVPYSKNSIFNLVDYNTVYEIIIYWFKHNIKGIFNVASKKNIKISSLSKKSKYYGKNNYDVGNISITKINKIKKSFLENSIDVFNRHKA